MDSVPEKVPDEQGSSRPLARLRAVEWAPGCCTLARWERTPWFNCKPQEGVFSVPPSVSDARRSRLVAPWTPDEYRFPELMRACGRALGRVCR